MSNRKQVLINLSNLSSNDKKSCLQMLSQKNIKMQKDQNGLYNATFVVKQGMSPKQVKPTKSPKHHSGKKPLYEVVNVTPYPLLLSLCKYVDVYVFPKRLSQRLTIETVQTLLEAYFRKNNFSSVAKSQKSLQFSQNFPQFLFSQLSSKEKQSSKMQQTLVNLIESINFFKAKSTSTKIFYEVLSENYKTKDLMLLYFLRRIIEDMKETKIVDRGRLKTDMDTLIIEEEFVQMLLDSLTDNQQQKANQFQRLKKHMRFQQKIKKNVILASDLIFLVLSNMSNKLFEDATEETETLQNLKDSSFSSSCDSKEQNTLNTSEPTTKISFSPEENKILIACLQVIKQLCQRTNAPIDTYDRSAEMISNLLECLIKGDKTGWFSHLNIEPANGSLYYVESLQKQFEEIKKCPDRDLICTSKFAKRLMQGPGIFDFFARIRMI